MDMGSKAPLHPQHGEYSRPLEYLQSTTRVPQENSESTLERTHARTRAQRCTRTHVALWMQAMNARSSRSHTVFQIIIEQKQKLGGNVDGLQVRCLELPSSTP